MGRGWRSLVFALIALVLVGGAVGCGGEAEQGRPAAHAGVDGPALRPEVQAARERLAADRRPRRALEAAERSARHQVEQAQARAARHLDDVRRSLHGAGEKDQ